MTGTIKRRKGFWFLVLYAAAFVVTSVVVVRMMFPQYGKVYPAKRLDAVSREIVQRALRMNFPESVRFDHATVIHGKDSTLYASATIADNDLEPLLKSASFETRPGKASDVQRDHPALPWWNFKAEEIPTVLHEVGGFTEIVVVKSLGSSRVFIVSGGGKSGFPADFWQLFQ